MATSEMTDSERLLHYVLGIVQGKIDPPNPDDPLRPAWDEYKRMGFDPLAQEWPVLTLAPPLPEEVLSSTRAAYDALRAHVEESGMTPESYGALAGMARVLGETPPARPGAPDRAKAAEERTGADLQPEDVLDGEDDLTGMCMRCRILDDVAAPLIERDGKPYCGRCQTDGSGRQL